MLASPGVTRTRVLHGTCRYPEGTICCTLLCSQKEGTWAEKDTLPTGYGPEYETDVLLLGGNDGPLAATFSAMGHVGERITVTTHKSDISFGRGSRPTSCAPSNTNVCRRW